MTQQWWRSAVVYQVYPRSFADSDGDGVGDLPGVTARLSHIEDLGADAVWLTPFQRSPQADHGYDVSDYVDVDPLFGTLDDFDELLATAHERDLKVIVDLVPNHCSDQHPLFQEALRAAPGSAARQRFHFSPGRGADGELPPNDWPSVFGGPAWTRVTEADGRPGEWYLHLYTPQQPDWNWRNPATHEFFRTVLRFWFDRGVDGIRIDVAHGLFKALGLPDLGETDIEPMRLRSNPLSCDQEEVHDIYREWRRITDSYSPDRVLVGEVNLAPERAARYLRPDELHQAFAFAFLVAPWGPAAWRDTITALLEGAQSSGSPVTWAVENHDVVRCATRYATGVSSVRGAARARAALLTTLALPGSAYLYQGQELGLPEADVPDAARQDPAWLRSGVSRDGCRVPLPWTAEPAATHGFSTTDAAPWLPVPDTWGAYAVASQQQDTLSALSLTRDALALRRILHEEHGLTAHDAVEVSVEDGLLLAVRGPLTLAVCMGEEPRPLPPGRVVLTSAPVPAGLLPPDAAAWVLR